MSVAAVACDQAHTHRRDIFVMFLVMVMVDQKRLFRPLSSFDVTQETVFPSLPQSVFGDCFSLPLHAVFGVISLKSEDLLHIIFVDPQPVVLHQNLMTVL